TLTFTGVAELPDGGYTAQTVVLPDVEADIEADVPGHISLADITLTNFYLPGGDTVTPLQMLQLVGAVSTGALSVTRNDVEVLAIDAMESASTFTPAQGSAALTDLNSTLSISGISADLSSIKDED